MSWEPCRTTRQRMHMSDDDFWADVARSLTALDSEHDPDDDVPDEMDIAVTVGECPVCGSTVACAYDTEGRALIHATDDEDDD